jgi:branched-chain amino acid transport system permease protein
MQGNKTVVGWLNANRSAAGFWVAVLAIFVIVQVGISLGMINDFWSTILLSGCAMVIMSLGLNLIYGFNGQFSLGQYAFYAIGAYASADITFRWAKGDASGLIVSLATLLLAGALMLLAAWVIRQFGTGDVTASTAFRPVPAGSAPAPSSGGRETVSPAATFALYLLATVAGAVAAVMVVSPLLSPAVAALLKSLPAGVAEHIVFFLAIICGGGMAALASFVFGLPVLTLGSDYFGIATLGFTVIVKVLLDNSDTTLGFAEMKGARGMVGIPKLTTWVWAFFFLLAVIVIMRNMLHSSTGRAVVAVREDEVAAKAMGIDVAGYKILAFVVGSTFAGIGGGLFAHNLAFLHPNTFNFVQSFNPLIIVVFGGLGSMTGTIFAGFAWGLVLEGVLRVYLPQGFETWRFVIYPVILLVMMLLRPQGLFGNFEVPFLRQASLSFRRPAAPAPALPVAEQVSK